jgi:murein DD-endopeptidase MepM/ murein hydrolase activator NlpD
MQMLLPFLPSISHQVTQGYNSLPSHQRELRWGVDFDLSFGENIYAVSDGSIEELIDSWPDGKTEASYWKQSGETYASAIKKDPSLGLSGIGNFLTLKASDGTYITYCHFGHKAIFANKTSTVRSGQLIGTVGRTGLRTRSHLHIHVGSAPTLWQAGKIANGLQDNSPVDTFTKLGGSVRVDHIKIQGDNSSFSPNPTIVPLINRDGRWA